MVKTIKVTNSLNILGAFALTTTGFAIADITHVNANTLCGSRNLYQSPSPNCVNKTNTKQEKKLGRLFAIYTSKEFNQTAHKQQIITISPQKDFPNMTLISGGPNQHAITILSSAKLASKKSIYNSTAALHIRCIANKTSVLFEFTQDKMSNAKSSSEVLYSVDNGSDQLLGLSLAKGESILGIWEGKKAVPFTKKLLNKNSLKINSWDIKGVEKIYNFDIRNLGKAIYNLRSACNW